MQIKKELTESIVISCQANEIQLALEHCSQNGYKIVSMYPVQDSRSGRYTNEVIIAIEPIISTLGQLDLTDETHRDYARREKDLP